MAISLTTTLGAPDQLAAHICRMVVTDRPQSPGFRGPHLLKFAHWDKEPYLAVLEVQTLRHEVLGIIFDPKPRESDHCNITGHKDRNLLRRIARKAWWEEGFAPPLKGLPCSTPGRSTANGSLRSATVQGNPAHQGTATPAGR